MLRSKQAWQAILDNAPRNEWLRVRELYVLVEAHSELDASDREPISRGSSTRWHRTVRNALQSARKRGEIRFERGRGFVLEAVVSASANPGTR